MKTMTGIVEVRGHQGAPPGWASTFPSMGVKAVAEDPKFRLYFDATRRRRALKAPRPF
jgi:hypothetical protein